MYAVVQTGGKQYRITAGSIIEVEKLEGTAGSNISINDVLALSGGSKIILGSPMVAGATVTAQIIAQGKGDKVIIFKKKRRHNYRRKNGHRQMITTLHITDISYQGTSLVSKPAREIKAAATTAVAAPAAKKAEATKPAAKKEMSIKKPAAKKAPAKKVPAKKSAS